MNRFWAVTSVLLVTLWVTGCGRQANGAAAAGGGVSTVASDEPTRAQGRLRTMKLYVGPSEITAELALTVDQIRAGMMFRTNMAENEGMLFVFGTPHRVAFWMKNVTVPMSCAYIDREGKILEIHDMEPGNEKPIQAASDKVMFVLETPRGWFEKNKVSVGMPVATGSGPLAQSFGLGR